MFFRCVRHRNIVDYYCAFVVTPKTGVVYQTEKGTGMHANIPEEDGPVATCSERTFGSVIDEVTPDKKYKQRWIDK